MTTTVLTSHLIKPLHHLARSTILIRTVSKTVINSSTKSTQHLLFNMSSNDIVIEIENLETITLDKEIERGSSSHEPIGDEFLSKATSDETSSSSSQEIPSNTMAYFVATSIGFKDGGGDITKSNLLRAIAVAGPSMVWCLFIQIVFLIALMNYIDGTDPEPSNSTSVVTLQICSISLFLVDICNTLRDLLVQAMIIF